MSKKFCNRHERFFEISEGCTYCEGLVIDEQQGRARALERWVSIKDVVEDEDEDTKPIPEYRNLVAGSGITISGDLGGTIGSAGYKSDDVAEISFDGVMPDGFDANGMFDGYDDLDLKIQCTFHSKIPMRYLMPEGEMNVLIVELKKLSQQTGLAIWTSIQTRKIPNGR